MTLSEFPYADSVDAHRQAIGLLTDKSLVNDMKNAVHGIDPTLYETNTSPNNLNPNTGKVSIAPYVPSKDFIKDIKSFMENQMGTVHEPIHKADLTALPPGSPLVKSGLFWAKSEIKTYTRNIEVIDAALKYMNP